MVRLIATLALGAAVTAGVQLPRVLPIRPAARIDLLAPGQGPIAGGTLVTISGTGLTNAAVLIDGQRVSPVTGSDTALTLQMPAHDNGYVVIAVAAPGSATVYGRYLYVPPRLEDLPPGYITTVAGIGNFKGDFGPALEASLLPTSIAIDADGNLYVTEPDFFEVSRIRTDGVIERFAGTGEAPGPGQECCRDGGPASRALLSYIKGVAVDRNGHVFIADDTNYRIRRVDAVTGIITTFAGTGSRGFSGDGGPASAAQIGTVTYLASNGVDLYLMDFGNARVRRIDGTGRITTVAGNGQTGFWGDGGPATEAMFHFTPGGDDGGLALDPAGNLFIIDASNGRVRRVDATTGHISTFATFNPLSHPRAIAADRDGNIYFYDGRLQKVSPSGTVIRTWGTPPGDLSPDGTSLDQLRFGYVTGITFDAAGNLIYTDQAVGRIRRMNFSTNVVETIAGASPGTIGEEGPAVGAALSFHNGADIGMTGSGDLLIADARVRRLTRDGTLTTIAGRALHVAAQSNLDNLPALNMYVGAMSLFVGPSDEIDTTSFLAVPYHIDARGIARRLTAPPGEDCGYSGDGGPATSAKLCQPWAIVRDRAGHAFIADTNNNRIRRIDAVTGIISTIAGNGGPVNGYENYLKGTFCGDGGPALTACLNTPYGLAFDADENLFVSDHGNNRIRKIDRNGIITTFVRMSPTATTIRFDRNGYLYASPSDRIVRFDRTGAMTVIAGTRDKPGFSGDGGPALSAQIDTQFGQSRGFAFNDQGDLFFVDFNNRRVRAVRGGAR